MSPGRLANRSANGRARHLTFVALLAACILALIWIYGSADKLVSEARSPDGGLVARVWRQTFFNYPQGFTLTLSASGADTPHGLPAADVVHSFRPASVDEDGPRPPSLSWMGQKLLFVVGGMPVGDDGKVIRYAVAKGVRINFDFGTALF